MFIALRWMQDPGGVMMWLAENIQACLRIFRRTQHQWLARDILHQPQGVYSVFVLWPHRTCIRPIRGEKKSLSSGVLPLTLLNLGCTRHSSSQLGSALICTRFQAEYHIGNYPGTPPPSVYQVTHGTALQAAECYVQPLSCEDRFLIGLR